MKTSIAVRGDYASHMSNMQFPFLLSRLENYRFQPTSMGVIVTLCCIFLFIKLGLWQYEKAGKKRELQSVYDSYLHRTPVGLPELIQDPEEWRYRKIKVTGEYVSSYQIILDNQVENGRAGYHIITPLRFGDAQRLVLVDRGWVPASPDRSRLPQIETPSGQMDVTGQGWIPSDKFYSLEDGSESTTRHWQTLWQNMDMKRYQSLVDYEVMPVVIRLDPASKAGGFVRNWLRPDERITTHIGYAYQWFGFAAAAFLIFIFVSFKRMNHD